MCPHSAHCGLPLHLLPDRSSSHRIRVFLCFHQFPQIETTSATMKLPSLVQNEVQGDGEAPSRSLLEEGFLVRPTQPARRLLRRSSREPQNMPRDSNLAPIQRARLFRFPKPRLFALRTYYGTKRMGDCRPRRQIHGLQRFLPTFSKSPL